MEKYTLYLLSDAPEHSHKPCSQNSYTPTHTGPWFSVNDEGMVADALSSGVDSCLAFQGHTHTHTIVRLLFSVEVASFRGHCIQTVCVCYGLSVAASHTCTVVFPR